MPFSKYASSKEDPPISHTIPVAFGQPNKTPEAANSPSSLPEIIWILILNFFYSNKFFWLGTFWILIHLIILGPYSFD